jgi:hypothetical protein
MKRVCCRETQDLDVANAVAELLAMKEELADLQSLIGND